MPRAFSITWRALAALFSVIVAIELLSFPDSSFEKLVVAALVLIYAAVAFWGNKLAHAMLLGQSASFARFVSILQSVKPEGVYLSPEDEEKIEKDIETDVKNDLVNYWINQTAPAVIALFAFSVLADVFL